MTVALSVVAPFFNERECLPELCARLQAVLESMGESYEVVLVDDGSVDGSTEHLAEHVVWPSCKIVCLASNAGHQQALDAGLQASRGDWVVTLDSDLQHPPECIPAMLELARTLDVDVVIATQASREQDTWFKRLTAGIYYRVASMLLGQKVMAHGADFRLMSRKAVAILSSIPGRKTFRILVPALNLKSAEFRFQAEPRFAGQAKYTARDMATLALRGFLETSEKPMQIIAISGFIVSLVSALCIPLVILAYVAGLTIAGWASIMVMLLLLAGFLFGVLGVIGMYLANIFSLLRGKPSYVVQRTVTLDH